MYRKKYPDKTWVSLGGTLGDMIFCN